MPAERNDQFAKRDLVSKRFLLPLKSWTELRQEEFDRQGDEIWLTDEEFDILADHPFSRRAESMREDFHIVPVTHWYRPSVNHIRPSRG